LLDYENQPIASSHSYRCQPFELAEFSPAAMTLVLQTEEGPNFSQLHQAIVIVRGKFYRRRKEAEWSRQLFFVVYID
jgi:hypothetical protein